LGQASHGQPWKDEKSPMGSFCVRRNGPISNLGIALVCAILVKTGLVSLSEAALNGHTAFSSLSAFIASYVSLALVVNLSLFFFNLIPLGPLDGHWLIGALLPPIPRNHWYKFCHGPGTLIFLALVFIHTPTFNPIGDYMGFTVINALRFMLGRGVF
jgi:Zn-dependent protease